MYRINLGVYTLVFTILKGDKIKMKMKKLLSIGALALVLATSTSIGAFAAEKPGNDKIVADMVSLILNDKSPIAYDIKADTVAGNVVNITKLQEDLNSYGFGVQPDGFPGQTYNTLNEALGLVESNKTIMYNARKIAVTLLQEGKFDQLLTEVRSMTLVLKDIENSSDNSTKLQIETDIKNLVQGSNSSLDVVFGKNKDGMATMTIVQGNQIILQLNSGNAYTISDSLGNNANKITAYVKLFGLIS
jgi:hypothetical protein